MIERTFDADKMRDIEDLQEKLENHIIAICDKIVKARAPQLVGAMLEAKNTNEISNSIKIDMVRKQNGEHPEDPLDCFYEIAIQCPEVKRVILDKLEAVKSVIEPDQQQLEF